MYLGPCQTFLVDLSHERSSRLLAKAVNYFRIKTSIILVFEISNQRVVWKTSNIYDEAFLQK